MKSIIISIVLVLLFQTSYSLQAAPLPVEYFTKLTEFKNVALSPKGSHLSVMSSKDGKDVLFILDRDSMKIINHVGFNGDAQVGNYHWVSDDRIVVEKHYLKGTFDHPVYYGELMAVDADGDNARYLVGYKGEMQAGSKIKKQTPVHGISRVLDPLIHDSKHMLITVDPWTANEENFLNVYKVNVRNGKRKRISRAPAKEPIYLTDHDGQLRFAYATKDYVSYQIYQKSTETGEWQELKSLVSSFHKFFPISFDQSGELVYALGSKEGEPEALYQLSLKNGEYKLLSQDDQVSPSRVWIDPASKELFAVEYEPGYPNYQFVDNASPLTKRLKGFINAFSGQQVHLVSSTYDGKFNVVLATSDKNPGDYYLYNKKKNKLAYLFSAKSWIEPNDMAEVRPIEFTARDGLQLTGYLTMPKGAKEKNLPLVVMPHGGPHDIRDWWRFNSEAQLLANRGIAVLQVNFRGSGGFGDAFENSGYKKWGSLIQTDILDGVNHLVEQQIVDKNNMCIMGASFGGYSALQSSIIAPDMFKCAIGVVGIYDLPMMFSEGDIQRRDSGVRYLKTVLGSDEAQLKAFSPTQNIDKLKTPVLIVHGGEDERAPIEQAEELIESLDKHKHPYEYLLLEDEGHGFYKAKHQTKYLNKVLEFLDKHLVI